MSTNCTVSEYIDGELRLSAAKFAEFQQLEIPDSCFLRDTDCFSHEGDEVVIIEPRWCGDWSGNSFDMLRNTILPATRGRADLYFIWEGGRAGYTGLRVEEGVVTEHDVVFSLGAPCSSSQQ